MACDPIIEAEIRAVLTDVLAAFTAREAERLFAHFVPDDSLLCYGSGADEKFIGRDGIRGAIERDWQQSDAAWIELQWIDISHAGDVAWLAADCFSNAVLGAQRLRYPGRLTGVLRRDAGRWRFVQWHFSVPDASQAPGQSYPSPIETLNQTVQAERPDLAAYAARDGTITLMFSDIEGSTELNTALGDARWVELLGEHNRLVREQVAAHDGYEVKSSGDGFMIVFASARRAVACARGIQRALVDHNRAAAHPLRVRIGLHTGEPIRQGDDFFGTHVATASRIAGAARGGETLVSSLVRALTEASGECAFDAGRELELKGLAGRHMVYALV